jgi:hypothetical protein
LPNSRKIKDAFHYTGKTRRRKRGERISTVLGNFPQTRVFSRYSSLLTYLTQIPKRGVEKKSKKVVARKKTLENGRRFRYNRRKIAPDSTARGTRHF